MKLRLSLKAAEDIDEIYLQSVLSFGLLQAASYSEGLGLALAFIAEMPFSVRERAELTSPVRVHPYQSRLIVFEVRDDHVFVVRVLHGRQDWEQHIS